VSTVESGPHASTHGPAARRALFGLELDALTLQEVLDRCEKAIAANARLLIGVVNAAKVVNLRRDPLLRESLLEADLLLADGQSVVWASWLLRRRLPERVAGIDLFERLLELADREHRSVSCWARDPRFSRSSCAG
jgi:N-acetylglucosaminyldiphosphoundecaprenol N-acetyl-beta-D-mannosaminyltransferase